jgi:hypothetical protein
VPKALQDTKEPTRGLYYGDGGTGKTTAAAAMANLGKVVIINAEQGVKSKPLRNRGIDVANIEVYPDPDDPEEKLSYEGLLGFWKQVREELHEDPNAYAGFVFDSVSEIAKIFLDDLLVIAVDKANRAGRERNPFAADQDNYRERNEQVRALIRKFRDLPAHFAVTALQRRDQDDDGTVTYQPGVSPGLQNDIIGYMDFVCVTSVALVDNEEEYRGLFRAFNRSRGKDRLDSVPRWLVDPTFDRVVAYVEEELGVEDDPIMQQARERALRAKQEDGSEKAAA